MNETTKFVLTGTPNIGFKPEQETIEAEVSVFKGTNEGLCIKFKIGNREVVSIAPFFDGGNVLISKGLSVDFDSHEAFGHNHLSPYVYEELTQLRTDKEAIERIGEMLRGERK
ncbi:MAG: hypothetical protein WC444_06645 [Candidatus Paceibacterota bacterium]